ncbi:MAG: hypothetical protein J2P53_04990 [Bradyrhizobiaceae bacterium]|nr:hypothetical protein [Bradyrhizobiaceae bacterium]
MRSIATVLALYAVLAANPAPAQEGPPSPDGGDFTRAGGTAGDGTKAPVAEAPPPVHDVESVPPRHGAATLWRRANVKALVANAANKANLPALNTPHVAPLPVRAGGAITPRNAIGAVIPPSGQRGTNVGSAAANGGTTMHQMPAPANAGQALHGAAINGSTMGGRTASRAGSIGGPAKDRSGVDGTSFRQRH